MSASDPAVILHDTAPDRVLVWMDAEELDALRAARAAADRYKAVLARVYTAATGRECTWQDSPDQMVRDAADAQADRNRLGRVVSQAQGVLIEWGLSMDDGTRHVHNTDVELYRRLLGALNV